MGKFEHAITKRPVLQKVANKGQGKITKRFVSVLMDLGDSGYVVCMGLSTTCGNFSHDTGTFSSNGKKIYLQTNWLIVCHEDDLTDFQFVQFDNITEVKAVNKFREAVRLNDYTVSEFVPHGKMMKQIVSKHELNDIFNALGV